MVNYSRRSFNIHIGSIVSHCGFLALYRRFCGNINNIIEVENILKYIQLWEIFNAHQSVSFKTKFRPMPYTLDTRDYTID